MSLDSAVARFRQRQAVLFRDEATVSAPGAKVFNPTTNAYSTELGVTRYAGACLIRPRAAMASTTEVGAQETNVSVVRLLAKFPVDTDVRIDDLVTVTASTYDEGLAGRTFVVVEVVHDGAQVCRRVTIEENLG